MNDDFRDTPKFSKRWFNSLLIFGLCGVIGVLCDFFDAITLVFQGPRWYHQLDPAVIFGFIAGICCTYALNRRFFRTRLLHEMDMIKGEKTIFSTPSFNERLKIEKTENLGD